LRVLNSNFQFGEGKGPVTYIENHDHSYVVAVVGGRDRWYETQPAAIALLTSPGSVMIHSGQEFGEDYLIPEEGPDRVSPRKLRWGSKGPDSGDFVDGRLFGIYRKLISIRGRHPALRSPNMFPYPDNVDGYGAFGDKGVVIYHRWGTADDGGFARYIIALNFANWGSPPTDIPFPANGRWDDLLSDSFFIVSDYRLRNQQIESNWGRIYYRKD
jgi:pullulanase